MNKNETSTCSRLFDILIAPVVTEKSARAGDLNNVHVFWVKPDARKHEIRAAVETLYKVKVEAVRTAIKAGEKRISGQHARFRMKQKKAYITLQEGQTIEVVDHGSH